jgi:DNA-binding MarR family transcriptional regulator
MMDISSLEPETPTTSAPATPRSGAGGKARGGRRGGAGTPPDDALAVANRLRPVLLRLHRYLRGEAHDLGVTSTQASLLGALLRAPGISLGALAQQEHMTAPTLVGHVDKLQAQGFVERARDDAGDRRRVSLRVTAEGERAHATLRERRTAWLAARLAALAPEELAAVEAAIEPLDRLVRRDA